MMAAANSLPTTIALPPTHPLRVTIPPHAIEQRHRHRQRLSRTLDQNRTLQILTILLIYIIVLFSYPMIQDREKNGWT